MVVVAFARKPVIPTKFATIIGVPAYLTVRDESVVLMAVAVTVERDPVARTRPVTNKVSVLITKLFSQNVSRTVVQTYRYTLRQLRVSPSSAADNEQIRRVVIQRHINVGQQPTA